MKQHRQLEDFPLKNVNDFSTHWWTWWRNNQPANRPVDDGGTYVHRPDAGVDWTVLHICGPTGLVLILHSLAWWGRAVHDFDNSEQQAWLDALEEVAFALGCVLQVAREAAVEGDGTSPKTVPRSVLYQCVNGVAR